MVNILLFSHNTSCLICVIKYFEDSLSFNSDEEDDDEALEHTTLEDCVGIRDDLHLGGNDKDMTDGSLNSESISRHDDSEIGRLAHAIDKQTIAIQHAIELFTSGIGSASDRRTTNSSDHLASTGVAKADRDSNSNGPSENQVKTLEEILEGIESSIKNVTDVGDSNSAESIQRGFSSIIMYIQKIIENPNISRYIQANIYFSSLPFDVRE